MKRKVCLAVLKTSLINGLHTSYVVAVFPDKTGSRTLTKTQALSTLYVSSMEELNELNMNSSYYYEVAHDIFNGLVYEGLAEVSIDGWTVTWSVEEVDFITESQEET